MRIFLTLIFATAIYAQTNPRCPGATGTTPHCITFTWAAPTTGPAPTSYNLYTGGTTAGNCASITSPTCNLVASIPAFPISVPMGTFTLNSSATEVLAEGSTHFFVMTSVNAPSSGSSAESAPTAEVSALIPFSPSTPASLTATAH